MSTQSWIQPIIDYCQLFCLNSSYDGTTPTKGTLLHKIPANSVDWSLASELGRIIAHFLILAGLRPLHEALLRSVRNHQTLLSRQQEVRRQCVRRAHAEVPLLRRLVRVPPRRRIKGPRHNWRRVICQYVNEGARHQPIPNIITILWNPNRSEMVLIRNKHKICRPIRQLYFILVLYNIAINVEPRIFWSYEMPDHCDSIPSLL